MTDADFLEQITAHPDDDLSRLAYADWLAERGDGDRAEFIQLQIALARLPKTDPRRPDLLARETSLLDQHACCWAAPLRGLVRQFIFRRGFVEKIEADLEVWTVERSRLFRLAPIRHIRSTGNHCHLEAVLSALPDLHRLTGLELYDLMIFRDDPDHGRLLLASPHLANLRTLIVEGNALEEDGLIAGLQSPLRANLRHLEVNFDAHSGPSEPVVQAMIASPYLKNVQKLNLMECRLSIELLAGLFLAMPRLERISLGRCIGSAEAWDLLLDRARQGQLRWLWLCDAVVGSNYNDEDIYHIRRYRRGFREAGVRVDWGSEMIDPWNGGCWKGRSWEAKP